MTNVYEGTFAQSTKLQSLTIPSGIRTIESYAFNGCTALTEIHCLGAEPATLNYYEGYDHPFNGIDASQVKVYVPKGFKSAYESSEWGYQFDNIIESIQVFSYKKVPTRRTTPKWNRSGLLKSLSPRMPLL